MLNEELERQPTEEACLRSLNKDQLKMLLCAMLPVVKIEADRYLVGT